MSALLMWANLNLPFELRYGVLSSGRTCDDTPGRGLPDSCPVDPSPWRDTSFRPPSSRHRRNGGRGRRSCLAACGWACSPRTAWYASAFLLLFLLWRLGDPHFSSSPLYTASKAKQLSICLNYRQSIQKAENSLFWTSGQIGGALESSQYLPL